MEHDRKDVIIDEYKGKQKLFEEFSETLEQLISNIIKTNKVSIHSITSRRKEIDSLSGKLFKNPNKYNNLDDITDLAGIRIITYFSEDVDLIANLIEKEFEIDKENSIDKRKILDPDRFGYLSMHYIIKLNRDRAKLIEYSRFSEFYAEIQIRTILQHTWAEIEHDLGYKSKLEVPKEIRRNFSRLAGLLEIADSEFLRIRNDLATYEKEVPYKIESHSKNVSIDKLSLEIFIKNNETILKLSQEIADILNYDLNLSTTFIETYIEKLHYLDINNISELDDLLQKYSPYIPTFADHWTAETMGRQLRGTVELGISIFYLCYILVASKGSLDYTRDYFTKCINSKSENIDVDAKKLNKIYKEII